MSETIERIAAKGDGVTATGRHVAFTAPGDIIEADGTVLPGPHRAQPPCSHFGRCGACQLQQCDEEALAGFVRERVVHAAMGQGLELRFVAPAHLSPPRTRRRATLRAMRAGGQVLLGFSERGSHWIVNLAECHVLDPRLFAMVEPLRRLLDPMLQRGGAEVQLTLVDQGVDCALGGVEPAGSEATEAMLDFCREHGLARLALDRGLGAETFWEPDPVTITLAGLPVDYPVGAFLQATADGEAALIEAATQWLAGCPTVADLFAGLGTFAFALTANGSQVLAAEAAQDAHLACRNAVRRAGLRVQPVHRDLFRNPLRAEELRVFDGVLLDPPRAGARAQVTQLAAAMVPRIVYVSCNPSSWARDGALLAEAGYELREVRPVGQFRWSTHVELASLFVRRG